MPVEFLSDDLVARFGRFDGEPTRADLDRFFYLDDADRELIGRRRGDHNRLGYALQLGTVRFLGTFLADPLDVPWRVVDHLAVQLGVVDPSCIKKYSQRYQTADEHAREIRTVYGYWELTKERTGELEAFLASRAWTHGERPTVLFEQGWAWLRRGRVLLPGASVLARMVSRARDDAATRMYSQIATAAQDADQRLPETLRGLLTAGVGNTKSRLEALRLGPTRTTGRGLEQALQRVESVRRIGAGVVDLTGVPAARTRELARYGTVAKAQSLRRLAEPRRTATMVATVAALEADAVDDALDLFDLLMSLKVLGPAKRAAQVALLGKMPELERASRVLARVGDAVLGVLDGAGEHVDVGAVWAAIEKVAPRERIAGAVAKVDELVPDDSGADGAMREQMTRKYRTVAPFLAMLATTIPWGATSVGRPLLDALAGLDALRGRRKVRAEEIDEDLVAPAWHGAVFGRADGVEVDRDAWVVCVLEQLRLALRRRDVFATVSNRWGDPRARMLSGTAWDAIRDQALTSLSLTGPASGHLHARVEVLDAAWKAMAAAMGDLGPNASVQLVDDESGRARLMVSPLEALDVPESLTDLRDLVAAMLPRVDLPELLLEVHAWTGFLDEYQGVSGGAKRMRELALSVAAVLVAQACNVGLTPVVAEGHPALTRDRLGHVATNYLRAETHAAANSRLIAAQAGVPIAQSWGGGLLASVDGLRFVVPVQSITTAPNSKYFGRGRGLTWFNAVNDQVAGIGAIVISGTERDSLYVLDTMLNLDGGPKPEVVASDTASYSDMVFGIFALLGYRFAPRIADLGDQRLWRATPPGQEPGDYGLLNDVARHKINWGKITEHWDDMTRLAASLATGAVRAYDVLRMLTRDGNPTTLGAAIVEYGRIAKTIHLLALIDPTDETYRRAIHTQLTVQESRHRLARDIFHGKRGQLHQRYREGQEDQLGTLGLVLNAVVLWNTRYTDAAITALRAAGHDIAETDVARLSPLSSAHINMLGRYAFTAPIPKALRELRDPHQTSQQS